MINRAFEKATDALAVEFVAEAKAKGAAGHVRDVLVAPVSAKLGASASSASSGPPHVLPRPPLPPALPPPHLLPPTAPLKRRRLG